MACPRLTMLRLSLRGQAKPLLRSLMGLLLRHRSGPRLATFRRGKPCSIGAFAKSRKGRPPRRERAPRSKTARLLRAVAVIRLRKRLSAGPAKMLVGQQHFVRSEEH